MLVLNNGGVYRGDEISQVTDPSPTVLDPGAHHERLIEAFGGSGYHVTTPRELGQALTVALSSGGPALIDCVLDPSAGTESGHISHLNPKSAVTPAPAGAAAP